MLESLLLISTGLVVGFLVGLTGVGGGALMTPVLILGFNISPVIAIATDLLFATLTKLATIPFHNSQGSIDWKSARMVWVGSIPGVVGGVILVLAVLQSTTIGLEMILAFVLAITSISMLKNHDPKISNSQAPRLSFFGGGLIGLSVATTSVGAGALGITIFRVLMGTKTAKNLVGTDVVHAIPIALIAGLSYLLAGFVDFGLLSLLLFGSIPAALIGARLSSKVSSGTLRRLLSVLLFGAAIGIASKALM